MASRKRRRRVALVTLAWHRHGGIERCVLAEAEGLAAAGDEVHIFAASFDAPLPKGVQGHRIEQPRLPWVLRLAAFAWRAPRAVAAAGPFDIVHAHTVYLGPCDLATAHSVHRVAMAVDPPAAGWRRLLLFLKGFPPLSVGLSDRVYRRARLRVAISDVVAQELRDCYGGAAEPLAVLRYGVDAAQFRPAAAAERRRLRAELGLSAGPWALFCGWNWRRKGLDVLLQAMRQLPQARLLVVGEDPLEGATFRQRVSELGLTERVRFEGTQKDPSRWFRAADLFVFPTRYEPFGMVVTEAMACGLPVLVPATAGAAEVLTGPRSSQVLPTAEDAEAWARAWGGLLRAPATRRRLGRANLTAARAFNWAAHVRGLRRLYDQEAR
jgi:UDP-glucose:(heptosyl)LPS alpha-1,3-glucosyltransferase